jgi:hypothetical protein
MQSIDMSLFDVTFDELDKDLDENVRHLKLNLLPDIAHWSDDELNRLRFERSTDKQPSLPSHAISVRQIIKMDDDGDERFFLEQLPDVVFHTSSTFQVTFFTRLRHPTCPIDAIDLEQLTVLTYKLYVLKHYQQLWHHYWLSGTGYFRLSDDNEQSTTTMSDLAHANDDRSVSLWPSEVHRQMRTRRADSKTATTVNETDPRQHVLLRTFTETRRHEFDDQIARYRSEYDTFTRRMKHWDDRLTNEIDQFVRTSAFDAMALYFEARIAMVRYTYVDYYLQWKYYQQKPTDEQVNDKDRCHCVAFLFIFLLRFV